jgi:hypothetical protein
MIHHHFKKWFVKRDLKSSAPLPPEEKILREQNLILKLMMRETKSNTKP